MASVSDAWPTFNDDKQQRTSNYATTLTEAEDKITMDFPIKDTTYYLHP